MSRMFAVTAQWLWDDEFKNLATTANSIDWNSLVERCELASFVNGQAQQVHVGDLRVGDDRVGFEDLKDTGVLRPEAMARGLTELAKDGKDSRHVPWAVRVVWVAGNPDKFIFSERTGCPGVLALFSEPPMG
jgi:hypothetical protein